MLQQLRVHRDVLLPDASKQRAPRRKRISVAAGLSVLRQPSTLRITAQMAATKAPIANARARATRSPVHSSRQTATLQTNPAQALVAVMIQPGWIDARVSPGVRMDSKPVERKSLSDMAAFCPRPRSRPTDV